MMILARVVSSLLLAFSIIHVYRSLGGNDGTKVVLLEVKGEPLFTPTSFITSVVIGLLFVATRDSQ
jgi:hypothetical protein